MLTEIKAVLKKLFCVNDDYVNYVTGADALILRTKNRRKFRCFVGAKKKSDKTLSNIIYGS